MVFFVNKLELSDQKYKTIGNLRDENYKWKFSFPMKNCVSFGTYLQSMYFMSIRFLKDKINGVRVPQFQLVQISDTTHPSHKNWLICVVKYIVCGGKFNIFNYRSGRITYSQIKQES